MATRDPRIDDYIERAAPFAQPILTRLREVVHTACPDVEETLKWKNPAFMHHGLLCGIAAFKEYCVIGFWKSKLILTADGTPAADAIGKITKVSELPPKKELIGYIKQAMQLNEDGVKPPRQTSARSRQALAVPADLLAALRRRRAHASFEAFSPSHQREYVEWIAEAKRDETRKRRIETAVEWIAEGKPRNWKYMR